MNATSHRAQAQNTATASVAKPAAAAPTEALDAFDFLERMDSIATHWEGINASLLETHRYHATVHPHPVEPLPSWAVERLQDQGRVESAAGEYRQQRSMLLEAIRLASGDGAVQRFEVWESAQGRRLSIQHESVAEADAELGLMKERFPKAFIARVDVRMKWSTANDPALLDTMIGRLWHSSTSFDCCGEGAMEDRVEIQDETGRTVTLPASVVLAHPTFARITEKGRQAIAHSVERSTRRRAEAGGGL